MHVFLRSFLQAQPSIREELMKISKSVRAFPEPSPPIRNDFGRQLMNEYLKTMDRVSRFY